MNKFAIKDSISNPSCAQRPLTHKKIRLSVIIPAYNEEKTIATVVNAVNAQSLPFLRIHEVIIVDDGSTDTTLHKVEQCRQMHTNLRICRHDTNRGKTAAIVSALPYVSGEVIMIQDADLEYVPKDYPALLAPFLSPDTDIVYGSRFKGTAQNMKKINFLANKFSSWTFNTLFSQNLTDINTCFKVFKASVLRKMDFCSRQFGFDTEFTVKAVRNGHRIKEVPVSYYARNRQDGKKMTWQAAVEMFWGIIYFRFAE